jgi:hypothetical protein
MKKIASPRDLCAELRLLIAGIEASTRRPSRERIATALRAMATRVAALPPPAKQLELMKKNPPRVTQSGDLHVVEVFSVTVGKYIPQGEFKDKGKAQADLKTWQDDHKRVLKALQDLASSKSLNV